MAIRTELTLRLPNSPGVLSHLCQQLTDANVSIHALTLESGGTLRLVVDNPLSAASLLREHQHAVEERDVLLVQVPNDAGALLTATRLLNRAGVNVEYAYGSAHEDHPMSAVVVGVDDAQRASMAAGV